MSTVTPVPVDPGPAVPPKVRTVAYFVGLGVGAASMLVTMITAAVAPHAAVTVLAVCGAFTTTTSFVIGGIAMFYRPTRNQPGEPDPAEFKPTRIDGKTWGNGTPVDGSPLVPSDPPVDPDAT